MFQISFSCTMKLMEQEHIVNIDETREFFFFFIKNLSNFKQNDLLIKHNFIKKNFTCPQGAIGIIKCFYTWPTPMEGGVHFIFYYNIKGIVKAKISPSRMCVWWHLEGSFEFSRSI